MGPPVWARPLAQVETPSGADFGLRLCPQDTCVALQALAEYAILSYAGGVNLTGGLCDPTDGSPPGSPVPGILQTRTLEWVAISFSNACK